MISDAALEIERRLRPPPPPSFLSVEKGWQEVLGLLVLSLLVVNCPKMTKHGSLDRIMSGVTATTFPHHTHRGQLG